MKKYLFRGKRLGGGEWVQGGIAPAYHNPPGDPFALEAAQGYAILADGRAYAVEQETIGQYTGLTDADGREIFEDDLVRMDYSPEHQIAGRVRYGLYHSMNGGAPNQGWWIEWNEEFWRPELAWWHKKIRVIGPWADNQAIWDQWKMEGAAHDRFQEN